MRPEDRQLVAEKVGQVPGILAETGIDAWILLARESDVLGDPSLPFVVGTSVTWASAFILTADGQRIALVGGGDVRNVESVGAYAEIVPYVEGLSEPLRAMLARLDPQRIGLNYAPGDYMADGLTHGMWLNLQDWLGGTPYLARIVPAEAVVARLRGRKSPEERRRIAAAVAATVEIWQGLAAWLRPGLSEEEIAGFLHAECRRRGLTTAWDPTYCPTVTAGPDSPVGHVPPQPIALEPGHLLSVDFGVRLEGYCSDMQRTFYVLRPGETTPPAAVRHAFAHVSQAIALGARALRPGARGWEVDAVLRDDFAARGLPEWLYGVGHQVGRACHDGGTLLGPRWERYGTMPEGQVEVGQVYALEIGFPVAGHGFVSAEENLVVAADGARFLAPPEQELIVIRGD